MLPIMFETKYGHYLAVPVSGLPFYILYVCINKDEWEPVRTSTTSSTVYNVSGTMYSRALVFKFMDYNFRSLGLRQVLRLEALIKYGFVTE